MEQSFIFMTTQSIKIDITIQPCTQAMFKINTTTMHSDSTDEFDGYWMDLPQGSNNSREPSRSALDDFAGFRVELEIHHSKNDALNSFLKTPAEKCEDACEVAMKKVMGMRKWDNYVERYVDPRFQSVICRRTTTDGFIYDDIIKQEEVNERHNVKELANTTRAQRGLLSKFACFTPQVSV
jgi:hypothetical protein